MKMPILFVGHGSPMNAIEDNTYTEGWKEIAKKLPKPKAILAISAHWYTRGSRINNEVKPRLIYDMYGFPKELYELRYDAPGSPEFAYKAMELLKGDLRVDNSWGIDHGTWSVLCRMFPKADIPVLQLSVDREAPADIQFQLGQKLSSLREEGVLIFGSGNVVHNLSAVRFDMEGGYPWAAEFDRYILNHIMQRDYQKVIHYEKAGEIAKAAFPIPDHFFPLLYILGAAREEDQLSVFNEACTLGSLSMTSYLFE